MSVRNGWLIYDPIDIPRNEWFIGELMQKAQENGISLRLFSSQPNKKKENCDFDAFPAPDLILNRSRDAEISQKWEKRGVRVFNSAAVTRIANDKWLTYQELGVKSGIPMAKSWLVTDEVPALPTPLVQKSPNGHGGSEVFWIADADARDKCKTALKRPFLLQEPVVTGWDVRIYILGGQPYAAVLRTSDSDFRSNFSLGGGVSLFQPDAPMLELLSRIQTLLPMDFAGVDILRRADGSYLLGEIEDAVGCRMLYSLADRDIAGDYIRYVSRCV